MGKYKHKWLQSTWEGLKEFGTYERSVCAVCGTVREKYKGTASYRNIHGNFLMDCPPCVPPMTTSAPVPDHVEEAPKQLSNPNQLNLF